MASAGKVYVYPNGAAVIPHESTEYYIGKTALLAPDPTNISVYDSTTNILIYNFSFTRAGYAFKEWNTSSDGTGTTYNVGDSVTGTGTKNLYAIWQEENHDVKIKYDNAVIGSLDASGTKTLLTSGKYCESNIEVIYAKPTPGVTEVEEKDVNFIDYDGTVLYSYTASEFAALTALPPNPTHDGLTAQGWNWTLADAKTHVAKYKQLVIGQNYVTSDGKTRVHIRLSSGRLSPKLGLCPNGSVDVDWGDGTAHSTVSGTSLTTVVNTEHAYASPGEYVITLAVTGSLEFKGTSAAGSTLLWKNAGSADENRPYQSAVKKVELGENVLLGGDAFAGCLSLSAVSIPNDMSFGSNGFQGCGALKALVMRSGISRIGGRMFRDCISLQHISTPKSIASLFDSAFQNVTALQSVPAFDGVANTGTYQFYRCLSLSSIEIPESVATIGACAFNGCTGLGAIHFRNATPPTVSNSNAFTNLPTDCVIHVPYSADHSILNAYKAATNYPDPSTYTYREETA